MRESIEILAIELMIILNQLHQGEICREQSLNRISALIEHIENGNQVQSSDNNKRLVLIKLDD